MDITREEIYHWIKRINDLKKEKNELYDCFWSDGIAACGTENLKEIHIFKGIEKIASILGGKTITYDPNYDDVRGLAYFYHEGIRFFEIWWKKEVLPVNAGK